MATDHTEGDSDDGMVAHIQQSTWTVSPGLPYEKVIPHYCGYFSLYHPSLQLLIPIPSLQWTPVPGLSPSDKPGCSSAQCG